MLKAVINAKEECEVAGFDLPGAYLSADMDSEVLMVLQEKLALLMVKTAPQIYRKYIAMTKDNKPVLYIRLQKALYGCLKSALLFYQKLWGGMEKHGFILNRYDQCVANKIIDNNRLTITWHVDN